MTSTTMKGRHLRALADEAKARFDHFEASREAAAEGCFPGPSPALVEKARLEWISAEAAADAVREAADA